MNSRFVFPKNVIRRRQTEPDVWLHVRELVGQDVTDHLHRHPITGHLLPHSQSPAAGERDRGA